MPCKECDGKGVIPTSEDAKYFVLRIDCGPDGPHDPNARSALLHYAHCVRGDNPIFASDILAWLDELGRSEVPRVSEAAETGTLAVLHDTMDQEELVDQQSPDESIRYSDVRLGTTAPPQMVAEQVPDMDAGVDEAIAAGGESVHPLKSVVGFLDRMLTKYLSLGTRDDRDGRLARRICRALIILDETKPERLALAPPVDVDALLARNDDVAMAAVAKALTARYHT